MSQANPANPSVFISYAREDAREIAVQLRDDLTAAGHAAWLDLSGISAGAAWEQEIEQAISSADVFLALMSVGSYVSDICRAEQSRALRKHKRLIPILLDEDADRPLALETRNYINLTKPERYATALQAIIQAIATGQIPAPRLTGSGGITTTQPAPPVEVPKRQQKRDSRAFRRYLADLREESWLGARHWWPNFLFYYADVQTIANVLTAGALNSPATNRRSKSRYDHDVRLFFRPRTPELFSREGCRPEAQRHDDACTVPVYLLFDSEALLIDADTRFCEGDPVTVNKTYKAASYFRDLPFDLIYHDSWFRSDERDEIMQARRAQVIVPNTLPLMHLRHIWCRSAAEYETLRSLLPVETWAQWRNTVTARADYVLFNRKWVYVDEATLLSDAIHLRLNPCDARESADCGPFDVRADFSHLDSGGSNGKRGNGSIYRVEIPAYAPDSTLTLSVPVNGAYAVRVYFDDALVYAGEFRQEPAVY